MSHHPNNSSTNNTSSTSSSSSSTSSSALANRVHDIIRRMNDNITQSEAIKTCYGILAIMSREESSKIIIIKHSLEIIINGMNTHLDKHDVQEAGCDLIWSLAFNNTLVKEMIGNIHGTNILVRGLKRHYKSPEYLKSACGALSNLCQFKLNQQNFASQGGLHPLLSSISFHQTNLKLLPFIFDALASLIVGNEENARIVTSQEGIVKILTVLSQHKESTSSPEIVKSGCHTLAILSDIKGHASKIALAGGVMIILPLLDLHSAYSDLHRVAAVVLLRMLQESSQVIRDIISHEGVRILLKSLDKGGAQQDTVAALTHILATVTNPLTTASLTSIESQLWLHHNNSSNSGTTPMSSRNSVGGVSALTTATAPPDAPGEKRPSNRFNRSDPRHFSTPQSAEILNGGNPRKSSNSNHNNNNNSNNDGTSNYNSASSSSSTTAATALGGLVRLMGQYSDRKDVSRASCRLLSHLIGTYPGVGMALDKLFILDRIMECLDHHSQTKDILESACTILKSLYKRSPLLSFNGHKLSSIRGLLFLFRMKCGTDEEIVTAATELLTKLISTEIQRPSQTQSQTQSIPVPPIHIKGLKGSSSSSSNNNTNTSANSNTISPSTFPLPSVSDWGQDSLSICCLVLENLAIGMRNGASVDRLQTPSPPQDRSGSNPSVMPPVVVGNGSGGSSATATATTTAAAAAAASSPSRVGTAPVSGANVTLPGMIWSKTTPKLLTTLLDHLELLIPLLFRTKDVSIIPEMMIPSLQTVHSALPARYAQEFSLRMNHVITSLQQIIHGPQESQPSLPPSRQNDSRNVISDRSMTRSGILDDNSHLKEWNENGDNSTLVSNERSKIFTLDSSNSKKSLSSQAQENSSIERFVQTYPAYLEPLATDSGQSSYSTTYTGRMQLCYENLSLPGGKDIQSRCAIPVPYSVPSGGLGLPFHHSIQFSSEFESANLYRAIQRDEREYDLCLRSDIHTPGHTQWFYFSVSNLFPEITEGSYFPHSVTSLPLKIKFNIINLTKPDSLFNQGMKPVLYGVNAAKTKNVGWIRSGSNISYFSNSYTRGNTSGEGNEYYYTLTFTMEFPDLSDTYYIAYYYPYTYSDHKAHLQELLTQPSNKDKLRAVKLCTTLGGYDCDLLIVTNFKENKETIGPIYNPPQTTLSSTPTSSSSPIPFYSSTLPSGGSGSGGGGGNGSGGIGIGMSNSSGGGSGVSSKSKANRSAVGGYSSQYRKGIVISARVHPGEPPASFMMKGFIDFITSTHPVANLLRSLYIFYLVPILNPDGVIFGNNRCNLSGVDLNRQWKTPLKSLHPTIYALKSLLQDQKNYRELYMYLDLHGHSRKYNIFLYGVDDNTQGNGPNPNYTTGTALSLTTLPTLMTSTKKSAKSYSKIRSFAKFFSLHSIGYNYVSYSDCSFHIRKGRESTARVIVAKEIGIPLSFTIEATFCGVNYGMMQTSHMNIGHYLEVGMSLCDVILQYGVAEGDILESIWSNYLRVGGGKEGLDLTIKSKMIQEVDERESQMCTERSSKLNTARSNSSGNILSSRDSSVLYSRQHSFNSVSRRSSQQSEVGNHENEIDKAVVAVEGRPGSEESNKGAEKIKENDSDVGGDEGVGEGNGDGDGEGEKEGEDDSDADGEDDDDDNPKGEVKGGGEYDQNNPIPDSDTPLEDEEARSLSPPAEETLPSRKGSNSSQSSQQTNINSSRRLIQTAGGAVDLSRASTCSTGRSESAPSSSVTQQPLSYPGYSLTHHTIAISSSLEYSASSSTQSPSISSNTVKRIARDDGFTFSESVLANRMIAGLNTVVTSQGATQQNTSTKSSSGSVGVGVGVGGLGGGSIPLIPSVNEGNSRKGASSSSASSISNSSSSTAGVGAGTGAGSGTGTGAGSGNASTVSMRPKKISRKGGLKSKKSKRKSRLDSSIFQEDQDSSSASTDPPLVNSNSHLHGRKMVSQDGFHDQHIPKLSLQQISLLEESHSSVTSSSNPNCGFPKVK